MADPLMASFIVIPRYHGVLPSPCQVITLGIDARFADTGTGLGRYTRELVQQIVSQKPEGVQFTLFVRDPHALWLHAIKDHVKLIRCNFTHYSLAEQVVFPWILWSSKINLLWSPHFNVPMFCPVPFVVTIHDLILHRFPNNASFLKRLAYNTLFRHAVKNAKKIIAVSHFTESELSTVYGARLTQKTTVIPEGVPDVFHPYDVTEAAPVLERYSITQPFFLYVGNAKEHKNLGLLFDAFSALPDTEAMLVLVSGGKELERHTLPGRTKVLSGVPDEDLALLYSLAQALVSPSLYEGFGLPIAEAAACGCPVIAIRGSAVSEIAPPSAQLVEPTLSAFSFALQHPPVRSGAVPQKSWSRVASETLNLLLS